MRLCIIPSYKDKMAMPANKPSAMDPMMTRLRSLLRQMFLQASMGIIIYSF